MEQLDEEERNMMEEIEEMKFPLVIHELSSKENTVIEEGERDTAPLELKGRMVQSPHVLSSPLHCYSIDPHSGMIL